MKKKKKNVRKYLMKILSISELKKHFFNKNSNYRRKKK